MDFRNLASELGGFGGIGNIGSIWNDLQERDWQSLIQTLSSHQGQDDGNDDGALEQMKGAAGQAKEDGDPFPNSPQELMGVLASKLGR